LTKLSSQEGGKFFSTLIVVNF